MTTNINATRTITNSQDGGNLTASDVQTIEFTEGGEVLGTSTENTGTGTVTVTELSPDVTVRKENGEVRATITHS